MKRSFTKEQLMSLLSGLDKNQLEDLIIDLYEDSDMVQKYVEMRFRFEEVSKNLLSEYENVIGRVFFPSANSSSFKANPEKADRVYEEFTKICPDLQDQGRLVFKILDCEMEILSYGYSSPAFCTAIISKLGELHTILKDLNSPSFDLFAAHKLQGYEDIILGFDGEEKKEMCLKVESILSAI